MEVKVNIAGQEMNVPVAPEQEAELQKQCEIKFMATFFRETSREIRQNYNFVTEETDCLVDTLFHAYPNLQELCEAIIANTYFKQVEEMAEGIVDERVKYYRVTVHYKGEFELAVKATSEEAAEDFVNDLDHYTLSDFLSDNAEDAEFDVNYASEDCYLTDHEIDFDATK